MSVSESGEREATPAATSFDVAAYSLRAGGEGDARALEQRLARLQPWYARFLRPWLPSDRSSAILDVPCGAGNLLFALKALGYTQVRGVDGDAGQVALARQLGLPAEVGDAFAVLAACAPQRTDRIFALDFLEHVSQQDAVRFCQLARRALAPGGLLLCRTPSADGPFGSHDRYNDLTHRWGMTSGAAVQLLQLGGFSAADVQVLGEPPVPYNGINLLRLALYRFTTAVVGTWLNLAGIGRPNIWTRSMWIIARVPASDSPE